MIDGTDDGDDDAYNYKDMLRRDERRWKRADGNGDNALDKKEFQDFLHPEDAEHMRDVVIDVSHMRTSVATAFLSDCSALFTRSIQFLF